MKPHASRHHSIRQILQRQCDDEPLLDQFETLLRRKYPRPACCSTRQLIMIKAKSALGFRRRLGLPFGLPTESVNGVRFGQKVRRELYGAPRDVEPAPIDTAAERHHGKAGQVRVARRRAHERLTITMQTDNASTVTGQNQFRGLVPQQDGLAHRRYFIL